LASAPTSPARCSLAAGDNPQRLRSEASFARLCGVAPLAASLGKTVRHRLDRGGDRQANNALWRIVLVRLAWDERTRDYLARGTKRGRSKKEVMRCLKRYVAREAYHCLTTADGAGPRQAGRDAHRAC
jgi:transposase